MAESVLMGQGRLLTHIPRDRWEQQIAKAPKESEELLKFMTDDHHRVRYFVVRQIPQYGKPLPPGKIAEALDLSLSRVIEILNDLEQNLFFLVRNAQGEVLWAFPVTADQTPHRLIADTGERITAA